MTRVESRTEVLLECKVASLTQAGKIGHVLSQPFALGLESRNWKDRRSFLESPASRRDMLRPRRKECFVVRSWRTSESGFVDSALTRSYDNERLALRSQCMAHRGEMLVFKDCHHQY